jgi:hypothetical protein
MFTLCQEVQKFLSACEDIQSLLAQGSSLTSDERDVIEQSAIDLLTNVKPDIWTRAFRKRLLLAGC